MAPVWTAGSVSLCVGLAQLKAEQVAKSFTYIFSTPNSSLTITTGDDTQFVTTRSGTYPVYAIPAISGTFNGQTVADFASGTGGSLYGIDGDGITFSTSAGNVYNMYLSNGAFELNTDNQSGVTNRQSGITAISTKYDSAVTCFAAGTLIRTSIGDVAVEALLVGDVVATASGASHPIRWLGHRTVDYRRHPHPEHVLPVRILAHAFGENRPSRDLFVSPGHAICVNVLGEMLIPAGLLVNGSTIVQVEVDEVTYWHVELDSHDIILAENLPAETYLDMGSRGFFREAQADDLDAEPDADPERGTHADFCRPYYNDGPVVAGIKNALRLRAIYSGWTLTRNLDLHLEVDGQRIDPVMRGLTARFYVPAGARDLTLVSPSARPCDVLEGTEDLRVLGLCLEGVAIDDGFGAEYAISIDDPRLVAGLHGVEDGCRRWTTGRTPLPADFAKAHPDGFYLRIELAGPAIPRWVAPAAPAVPAKQRPRLSIVD